jgi:peptidyl-prolyl cis-trans isomerase D
MYEIVTKHKRAVQFILVLITLPFAFFGVDSYFGFSEGIGEVATFDGGRITQAEFAQSLRERQEMLMRTQRGVDPAMFENPRSASTSCSSSSASGCWEEGAELHFGVSNAQIFDKISADPRFRDGPTFSLDQYKRLLAQAGIPESSYEDSVRKQLLAEKLVDPIARGASSRGRPARFRDAARQQREWPSPASTPRRSSGREARRRGREGVLRRQQGAFGRPRK